jgi:phosphate transport system permease protein
MSDAKLNMAAISAADALKRQPLVLNYRQEIGKFLVQHIGRLTLLLITCTSVFSVLLIFYFIIKEALPFLQQFSLAEFFTSIGWYPQAQPPQFGALSLIAGSFYVTVTAMIIAVPAGIFAAVFLSDIVSFRVQSIVKPIIELLAAIPSVAYGFFACIVLAPWMQRHLGFSTGVNALNASIILAVMALPTIISVAQDSLSAVGRELREASYGLGATRTETIFKVLIPAAHSGIIAAVILGMMRAIGETMVVWMASGNAAKIPSPWWDLTQSVRTMTATIAGDMGETAKGSEHYRALFSIGLLLLVMTLMLNLLSEYFLSRTMKKSKVKK